MPAYEYRLVLMNPKDTEPKDDVHGKGTVPSVRCNVAYMVNNLQAWGRESWQIVSDITFSGGAREMIMMREITPMKEEASALEI